jgi:hypothetical protein
MDTYVGSSPVASDLCCSYKIRAGANMFHNCIALRTISSKRVDVVHLYTGGGQLCLTDSVEYNDSSLPAPLVFGARWVG